MGRPDSAKHAKKKGPTRAAPCPPLSTSSSDTSPAPSPSPDSPPTTSPSDTSSTHPEDACTSDASRAVSTFEEAPEEVLTPLDRPRIRSQPRSGLRNPEALTVVSPHYRDLVYGQGRMKGKAAAHTGAPPQQPPGMELDNQDSVNKPQMLAALNPTHDLANLSLEALHQDRSAGRPQYTYPALARCAILGHPKKRMTLSDIYDDIIARFPFYGTPEAGGWKSSIRHMLSLSACFVKVPRPVTEPGKGAYWTVDLNSQEGDKKRKRKRNRAPSKRKRNEELPTPDGSEDEMDEDEENQILPETVHQQPVSRSSLSQDALRSGRSSSSSRDRCESFTSASSEQAASHKARSQKTSSITRSSSLPAVRSTTVPQVRSELVVLQISPSRNPPPPIRSSSRSSGARSERATSVHSEQAVSQRSARLHASSANHRSSGLSSRARSGSPAWNSSTEGLPMIAENLEFSTADINLSAEQDGRPQPRPRATQPQVSESTPELFSGEQGTTQRPNPLHEDDAERSERPSKKCRVVEADTISQPQTELQIRLPSVNAILQPNLAAGNALPIPSSTRAGLFTRAHNPFPGGRFAFAASESQAPVGGAFASYAAASPPSAFLPRGGAPSSSKDKEVMKNGEVNHFISHGGKGWPAARRVVT